MNKLNLITKRMLFHLILFSILLIFFVAILEASSFAFYYFRYGVNRSDIIRTLYGAETKLIDKIKQVAIRDTTPEWMRDHVLHPYLGFVRNYDTKQHIFAGVVIDDTVNEFGFFGDAPAKDKPDNVISIAIMGGSVAVELFIYSRDTLLNELKKHPRFSDKKIRIYSIALGGMKQPQQSLALNYFLALGYFFDIVINIDGYNEAILPYSDNIRFGVFPFYPRSWRLYSTKSLSLQTVVVIGEIKKNRMDTEKWRSLISNSFLRNSNFILALWYSYYKRKENEEVRLENILTSFLQSKNILSAQERGPSYSFQERSQVVVDSVELWKRTSIQMWKLCLANGIEFYHFLQPNQYVIGSKELSEWEKKYAFADKTFLYRQGVEQGYPLLMSEGKNLVKLGVPFVDMTRIFWNEDRTIYKDAYCHYNQYGNDKIAKEIGNIIGKNASR